MNVKELREKLADLPDDAEVLCFGMHSPGYLSVQTQDGTETPVIDGD